MAIDYAMINQTMGKMAHYLSNHDSIVVAVSGGSDSNIIVHMIATYFRDYLDKIHFVFSNTGLEFQATKDHLDYMEQRYDITIERIRGMSVVTAVRKYGVPVISKKFSNLAHYYAQEKQWAIDEINNKRGASTKNRVSPKQVKIANAIKDRNMSVSSQCCYHSKKSPMRAYERSVDCDLVVTGERKAEGGARKFAHKSCFETNKQYGYDKYMPLFFWNDETKQYYKEKEEIKYSDCYEVWGMKRTGCVGCPFNAYVGQELEIIKKYEPKVYTACLNVFGDSYRLTDEFGAHKHSILSQNTDTKKQNN